MRDYKPPIVWITGASSGIGKHLAIQFSLIGCKVILSSRNVSKLKSTVKIITKYGGIATIVPMDIIKQKDIDHAYKYIRSKIGNIDVLINNAGITSFRNFSTTSMNEFKNIINVNLIGTFACIKRVLPNMIKHKNGWIINILSVVTKKVFKNSAAYTAAKSGLDGMLKVLREEVRKYNIKVVSIYPGATATPIWGRKLKTFKAQMMDPESVAKMIVDMYRLTPEGTMIEEFIIRPVSGDLE